MTFLIPLSTPDDCSWPRATRRLLATWMKPLEFVVIALMMDVAFVASTLLEPCTVSDQ